MNSANIGVGNDMTMPQRSAYDQKMLDKFNPMLEGYEYKGAGIGVLGDPMTVATYAARTPRDMAMIQKYGCGGSARMPSNEGYCSTVGSASPYMVASGTAPVMSCASPSSNCTCGAGKPCPFARTTDNPFNPWSQFATYNPLN